ncbi:MAG TPA: protein YgfX [Dokdonella sp.]|nr:protein YgfX [Dokdonella sp.]
MRSAPSIAFDYRPSAVVAAAAVVLTVAAALSPWPSGAPPWLRLLLSLLALGGGAIGLRRFLRPPFRRIVRRASGWRLVDRDDREQAAVLHAHRQLGALLVLDWRCAPRAHFRVLLAPDNLDADTRRRLVLLLARGEPPEAEAIP